MRLSSRWEKNREFSSRRDWHLDDKRIGLFCKRALWKRWEKNREFSSRRDCRGDDKRIGCLNQIKIALCFGRTMKRSKFSHHRNHINMKRDKQKRPVYMKGDKQNKPHKQKRPAYMKRDKQKRPAYMKRDLLHTELCFERTMNPPPLYRGLFWVSSPDETPHLI